jgi:predicted  nucleic acid-binding Zn-ribbon protein
MALANLRSEVITLRNEALEKDKILLSLVDRLKSSEAKFNAQSEAHKAEVEGLKKKLTEMNEDFEVAKAKQEISEWTSSRLQKNVDELRESKERCYEKSLDCAKKLKDSFAKVGAYSSDSKKLFEAIPKESLNGSAKKLTLLTKYLATVGISAPSPVPEGLQQFWRKLAVNMLKLQPRQKLPSP